MHKANQVILSVTAHPDDEVLGFGGTAIKLTSLGNKVVNAILSGGAEARAHHYSAQELLNHTHEAQVLLGCEPPILGSFPNISFNTVPHLDLVRFIEAAILKIEPDYIFTHHPNDLNNDHHHTSIACQAAARLFQRQDTKPIKGLFFMEILSSTDWAFTIGSGSFQANSFVEIGPECLQKKIESLGAYKDVLRPFPHPRSPEILKSLAAYRGGQAGMKYAEAFQVVYQNLMQL